MHDHIKAIMWLPFFIAPLFWVASLSSYLSSDMLFLSCGLAAAAALTKQDTDATPWHWLFFALLTLPVFLHYLEGTLSAPWQEFRLYFYLATAWLIFRMSRSYAANLIQSREWNILLAIVGIFYVVFAICGMYRVHPFSGTAFFPIWAPNQNDFGGPLIQRNLESLFMCLITVTLLFQSVKFKQQRIFWILPALLPCAGIFLSSSRAASIVFASGIIFSLFMVPRKKEYLINTFVCIAGALLLTAYLHIPGSETVAERFASESTGLTPRLFIWSLSSMLIWEHPWIGIGWGNLVAHGSDAQILLLNHFPSLASWQPSMEGSHAWTHNFFLEFMLATGIFGGLSALIIAFSLLRRLYLTLRHRSDHGESCVAVVGATMMLIHGMVSVALFQGFFLVLFALYMAGAFPSRPAEEDSTIRVRLFYFIPALIAISIWYSMTTTQWELEKRLGMPMQSDEFLISMANALDNPWTHTQALRHYTGKMALGHAPGSIWVRSEPYIYALWNDFQSSVHLKFLIVLAHMKSDKLMEDRLINYFVAAFPTNPECQRLLKHKESGHDQGEPIDVWQ